MTIIHIKAGEPISVDVKEDTLTWRHENVQTKQKCADLIDTQSHPVAQWEPLSIEGRLTCSKCGLEGSINSGKWLRVFKREPGQTQGEGYAAWKLYCKEAGKRMRQEEGKAKRSEGG